MIGFNAIEVLPTTYQPDWIAGCQLWLQAQLGITIATGVSQWNDLSGNGNNVFQATGSQQPTYNATDAGYNGKPTLSFAAASSQSLGASIASIGQPYTIIVVGQNTNGGAIVGSGGSLAGLYGTNLSYYAGSGIASSTSDTSKCVMCGVFNNAGTSGLFLNNSQTALLTTTPGTRSFTGSVLLGNEPLADAINGKIAEVMIYNSALSAAQLHTVFAYLGSRYNIATS
jgi:hypothetical protein